MMKKAKKGKKFQCKFNEANEVTGVIPWKPRKYDKLWKRCNMPDALKNAERQPTNPKSEIHPNYGFSGSIERYFLDFFWIILAGHESSAGRQRTTQ